MEAWIVNEVKNGAALPGLYPMNAETKARYEKQRNSRANRRNEGDPPCKSIPQARGRRAGRLPNTSPARSAGPDHPAPAPARLVINRVVFEPGARTAWHTHPLGQTLYVISGVGRVQAQGGPVAKSSPATWSGFRRARSIGMAVRRTTRMTHIATQEAQDGSYATWMEHVSDADYNAAPG